jgi:hypothetical protein
VKKIVLVLGLVLMVMGSVWALQGLNILPGTFMRGDPLWVGVGSAVAMIGLLVLGYGYYERKG